MGSARDGELIGDRGFPRAGLGRPEIAVEILEQSDLGTTFRKRVVKNRLSLFFSALRAVAEGREAPVTTYVSVLIATSGACSGRSKMKFDKF